MGSPKRILIIQLKRVGDVIVTTPVIPALLQVLPEAKIDFLVDKPFATLLENNPHIDQILIYDRQAVWSTWHKLRAAGYDWILDFQSSPRSVLAGLYSRAPVRAGYQVPFWGRVFSRTVMRPGGRISATEGKMTLVRALLPSAPPAGERKIYLTESERRWATAQFGSGTSTIVGIIPTHRRASRRWHADSFSALVRLLEGQGLQVYFFWGPGEKTYVEAIAKDCPGSRLIPSTGLREMAALLEQCKMVITNDNGPMHLATAVNTPTLTIYGPTDPIAWNPGGPRHGVVQAANLRCLGCNMNECPFGHECMAWINPASILARCKEMLSATPVENFQ